MNKNNQKNKYASRNLTNLMTIGMKIADYYSTPDADGNYILDDSLLDYCGLGCMSAASDLRRGLIELMKLQINYSRVQESMQWYKSAYEGDEKFIRDAFGISNITDYFENEEINEDKLIKYLDKAKVKNFVLKLIEEDDL